MTDGASAVAARAPEASTAREQAVWVQCPTCDGPINRGTGRCPHCGAYTRRSWRLSRLAMAAGVLVAVAFVIRRRITNRRQ